MTKIKNIENSEIKKALKDALSYEEYLVQIEKEVKQNANTEQEKMLKEYTKLNQSRIRRLNKNQEIPLEVQKKIQAINKKLVWVVLTEGWCGDAAQSVPILNKLAELNPNIELKIVLRDTNIDLMDLFLTNGGRSIPKLLVWDTEEVLFTWGPRPTEATKLIMDYKEKHGVIDEKIRHDLQLWYNKDKGEGLMQDIIALHSEFMNQ